MNFYIRTLAILLGIYGSCQAGYHSRRSTERCTKLANAMGDFVDSFPYHVSCFISKFSEQVLGYNIIARESTDRLSCLFADNADSGADLFDAFDNAGYIDLLLEVAYSGGSGMGANLIGLLEKAGLDVELNKCGYENYYAGQMAHFVSQEDFQNLVQTVEDLQIFSLNPELTNKMATVVGFVVGMRGPATGIFEPCTCTAITEPEERCRLAQKATAPFVRALTQDQGFMRTLTEVRAYVQTYTGISLLDDFENDVQDLVCKIAKIQQVGEIRTLLGGLGLLDVGWELGVGFACVGLQISRRHNQFIIEQYEDTGDNEYSMYGWKPSDDEVALARATNNLADVWLELGFDSIPLENVPAVPKGLFQQQCRAPQSGTPNPYY